MDLDLDSFKLPRGMDQKVKEISDDYSGLDWWPGIDVKGAPDGVLSAKSMCPTFVRSTKIGKMNVNTRSQKGGYLLLGDRKGYEGAFWILECSVTLDLDEGRTEST